MDVTPFVKSRRFSEEEATLETLAEPSVSATCPVEGVRWLVSSEADEAEALLWRNRRGFRSACSICGPGLRFALAQCTCSGKFARPIAVVACFVVCLVAFSAGMHVQRTSDTAYRDTREVQTETPHVLTTATETIDIGQLKVAIVGGGIAGITTALELLMQRHTRVEVTIFEQSPSLSESTSSMIAGTINLDTAYRDWLHGKGMFSVYEMVRGGFASSTMNGDTRWANFLVNTATGMAQDPRASTVQKRSVFRKSYEELERLIRHYPKLCVALMGQWCCDSSDAARQYMETVAGVKCPRLADPKSSPLGLFQITSDPQMCTWMREAANNPVVGCDDNAFGTKDSCEFAGHVWADVKYTFYNSSETRDRLSGYLLSDDDDFCSLVEHRITGFARSEVWFELVGDILRSEGVNLALGCNVVSLNPLGTPDGRVRVVTDDKIGGCSSGSQDFDRVVVAAAAASVPLLTEVDPLLRNHLVGIKGYGLSGAAGSPKIPANQLGRGLHFMDMSRRFAAAYARSTSKMRVKVWGGHDVSATDEGVEPPYAFCSHAEKQHIFEEGPACASALVNLSTTVRMAGMRPVPSIGNVPLIKRYEGLWRNVLLNSGYGYNGYDLSWFASMCTSRWLTTDQLADPVCASAGKVGSET